jgi:hypothetical protein
VCAQTVPPFRHFSLYTEINNCICVMLENVVALSTFVDSA